MSEITVYNLTAINLFGPLWRVGAGSLLKLSVNSYNPYIGQVQCTRLSSYAVVLLVAETYEKRRIFAPW